MFGSKKKSMEETLRQQEQEMQLLRNRANELTEKLVRFQGKEEAIISALTNAQDSANKTVNSAICKRDELIENAKKQSEAMKTEAKTMLDNARHECAQLISRTNQEKEKLLADARSEAKQITEAANNEANHRIEVADQVAKEADETAQKLKADFTFMLQTSVAAYKNAAKDLSNQLNAIANEAAIQADQLRLCCENNNKLDDELKKIDVYSELNFEMLVKRKDSGDYIENEAVENEIFGTTDVSYRENEEGELTYAQEDELISNNEVEQPTCAVTVEEVVTAHMDDKSSSVVPPVSDESDKVWTVDEVEKTVPIETELRSDDDLNTLLNELLRS